jgi:hypothetical protein
MNILALAQNTDVDYPWYASPAAVLGVCLGLLWLVYVASKFRRRK